MWFWQDTNDNISEVEVHKAFTLFWYILPSIVARVVYYSSFFFSQTKELPRLPGSEVNDDKLTTTKLKQEVSYQSQKIPNPIPPKELSPTQPKEKDSNETSVMAASLAGQR